MAAEAAPYGRVTQKAPAVAEVHVVWITAGLGYDIHRRQRNQVSKT